jgi:hypothetical protein
MQGAAGKRVPEAALMVQRRGAGRLTRGMISRVRVDGTTARLARRRRTRPRQAGRRTWPAHKEVQAEVLESSLGSGRNENGHRTGAIDLLESNGGSGGVVTIK